ncbi:MAG: site-2 protease family protein [Verrucomicrobiia bacterium]
MKWSWKIGRIFGIGVYMHVTFLILLGWVAASHYFVRNRWEDALYGLAFILLLFGIVVLHELGHALAARRFGIRTRDITLLPIGGVARLERMPEDPKQELLVALAGPAVNVALAAVLFVVLLAGGGVQAPGAMQFVGGDLLSKLLWVNVALAVFNMLPAFPMDGGRVLRALLAIRMDYVRATHIAANIGQGMAFLFGFLGLFSNPFLVFIALFVWMGASQEAGMVEMKSALSGVPVERVMITKFRTLHPGDALATAVEQILAGAQQDFPVLENDEVVGILTRKDLLTGLAKGGQTAEVRDYMERDIQVASPSELAERVLARVQECKCHTLPVVNNGELVGIFTMENLGEFMMIQTALHGEQQNFSRYAVDFTGRRAA